MTTEELRQVMKTKSTSAIKMNIADFHSKALRNDRTALNGWAIQRKLNRTVRLLVEELSRRDHTTTEFTTQMLRQYWVPQCTCAGCIRSSHE